MAIDIVGACCAGALDAAARCCAPPAALDGFGVCGGVSTSGATALSLSVASARGAQGKLVLLFTLLPPWWEGGRQMPQLRIPLSWPGGADIPMGHR